VIAGRMRSLCVRHSHSARELVGRGGEAQGVEDYNDAVDGVSSWKVGRDEKLWCGYNFITSGKRDKVQYRCSRRGPPNHTVL